MAVIGVHAVVRWVPGKRVELVAITLADVFLCGSWYPLGVSHVGELFDRRPLVRVRRLGDRRGPNRGVAVVPFERRSVARTGQRAAREGGRRAADYHAG